MKSITTIFVFLLAGVYASSIYYEPQVQKEPTIEGPDSRFVGDLIASALEEVSQQIREAGLDPWIFDRAGLDYELPVPVIFSVNFIAENIVFRGLSNIVINHINFAILAGRLTLDISLPEMSINIGNLALDAVTLGANTNIHMSGRLAVVEPRISGEVVLNLAGVIGGPLIRSMDLEFDLGGIEYNGRFSMFGVDMSQRLSNFVSVNIPNAVREHTEEINELVEIIARQIITDLLA